VHKQGNMWSRARSLLGDMVHPCAVPVAQPVAQLDKREDSMIQKAEPVYDQPHRMNAAADAVNACHCRPSMPEPYVTQVPRLT
jgi:hypothetical protein